MRRFVLAAMGAIFLSAQAPAPPPPATALAPAQAALSQGRYLEANDAFAAAAFGQDGKVRDQASFGIWAQVSTFLTGELDPAISDRTGFEGKPNTEWAARIAGAAPRDAIEEIVRRARTTSIVIVNEAHVSPRDRAFALEVARALRPLGYSILAAETFGNVPPTDPHPWPMERLQQDGIVRLGTGFYTKDPVFAGFVRQALSLGYRPVAYEMTFAQRKPGVPAEKPSDMIAMREQAQAENLMAGIFASQPKAKVLIYVGYSHAGEAPLPAPDGTIEWMAARLKRMTGIDPLTIDQTTLTDISSQSRPAHVAAAARIGARPAVFFEGDRPLVLGVYADAVDLQVVHPSRAYQSGRPAWLAQLGGSPREIPRELLPTSGKRLVQAFAADAPADAVPLDQVLVTAGSPTPSLMLPPGPVRFATQP